MEVFAKNIGKWILTSILISQYSFGSIPENFHISINQPFYLSGETIWYNIYKTNYNEQKAHSSVVYVNLHDKSGALKSQQKLKLENGVTSGSLELPIVLNEGYYYLTCFSKWNLQFENAKLTCLQIPVYNPFMIASSEPGSEEQSQNNLFSNQEQIEIKLNKTSYSRREQVEIQIAPFDEKTMSLSLSVHALHKFSNDDPQSVEAKYEIIPATTKENTLRIEGYANDPDSEQPLTSGVISLFQVGTNEFIKTSSKKGQIEIELSDFFGIKQFQLFNMNPYQATNPDFKRIINGQILLGLESNELKRSKNIEGYIQNVVLNNKVKEIFEERRFDSIQNKTFQAIPFKADKVYKMEKYQYLKDFEEFIKEIIFHIELRKEDGHTTARLKNSETRRFFMEKPWYLIDGYLTRDEDAVFSIPFKNLLRVEIFNTNKTILGQLETTMIRSGMIAIYTTNNHMKSTFDDGKNMFYFDGFFPEKIFVQVHRQEISRENPAFFHSLYWTPQLSVSEPASVNFLTSDYMGEYIVQVEGLTENGKIIKGSKIFTVNY